LLRKMRNEMGDAGGILIGVDLKKDHASSRRLTTIAPVSRPDSRSTC
jgi:hypothetical protein